MVGKHRGYGKFYQRKEIEILTKIIIFLRGLLFFYLIHLMKKLLSSTFFSIFLRAFFIVASSSSTRDRRTSVVATKILLNLSMLDLLYLDAAYLLYINGVDVQIVHFSACVTDILLIQEAQHIIIYRSFSKGRIGIAVMGNAL